MNVTLPEFARPEAALPAASCPSPWVPIRMLGPRHRQRIADHLRSLDAADRAMRFGFAVSDDQLARYVASMDFERDEFHGVFDRALGLVAVAHLALDDDGRTAEFAVSVAHGQRGRRIASRLLAHAATHARNRGVGAITVYAARDNAAMLSVARRAGAVIHFDGAQAVAVIALPSDTLGTQVEALLGHRAAEWDYLLKVHALRWERFWFPTGDSAAPNG